MNLRSRRAARAAGWESFVLLFPSVPSVSFDEFCAFRTNSSPEVRSISAPMKTSMKLIAVLACGLLGGTIFSGCASTATRQSTGEYVDDATTTARVKTALIRDDTVKARQVDVETFKGHVQLNGFVETEAQRARAEQIATGIEGVQQVTNNLALRTADGQSAGSFVDDSAITAKVKAAMASDAQVSARQVQVETYGGTVQLSGFVDTQEQRTRAEEVARSVAGVRNVQNQLTVKVPTE